MIQRCAFLALACFVASLAYADDPAPAAGTFVLRAAYEGRTSGAEAAFTVRIDARRFGDAWGEVPLPPGDFKILSWSCEPAGGARFLSGGAAPKFLLEGQGPCRIELKIAVPVAQSGALSSVELPLVSAAAATVDFDAEGKDLVFAAAPEAPLESQGGHVHIVPAPGDSLSLSWSPRDRQSEVGPAFRSDDRTLYGVGAGVVDAVSRCRLIVERGSVERVALKLAPGASVLAVEGDAVAEWFVEEAADGRRLRIRFSPRVTAETTFRVHHDAPVDALPGSLSLSPPALEGAREQAGTIAVAADDQLATREEKIQGAERVDLSTLKAAFPEQGDGLRAGYHYGRLPAAVALAVERKAPRLRVTSESSVLLEKDALVLRTLAAVTIDDIGATSLRFKLPADLTVLTVSGKAVRDWRAAGDVLQVNLVRRTLGGVAMQIEAQASTPGNGEIALPRLELLDAMEAAEFVGVTPRGEIAVETAGLTGAAQADPGELPAWLQKVGARLAYRLRERHAEVRVAVSPLAPEVRVQVLSSFRIDSDRTTGAHHVIADVTRAPVFAVDLSLPAGQEALAVSGRRVRDWTFRDADRTLHVDLDGGAVGALDFSLMTEARHPGLPGTAALGGPAWKGAKEQRSWAVASAGQEIELTPGAGVKAQEATPAELPQELRAAGASFAWRCADPAWSVKVAAKAMEPRLEARNVTVAEIRRGLVTALCVIDLDVQRAGVRRLRVKFPAGAVNTSVDADGLQSRRQDGDAWELSFGGSQRGAVRLKAGYEMAVPDGDPQVRLAPPEIAGVERQTGLVLVARDESGSEVELVSSDGMSPVRREELPQEFRDAALAYTHLLQFAQGTGAAVFKVKTHERGQVEAARMTGCDLHTIVQADGDALTYLTAHVVNTSKQYLELAFPDPKTTVWGGYVNGEPVKLSLGEGGKVRIPLPRANLGNVESEVAVVWAQKIGALGLAAKPSFRAPASDVKMESVRWALYLPNGYHMLSSEGSLSLAHVDEAMQAPNAIGRMGRILENSIPFQVMDAVPWALGGVGFLAVIVMLLYMRDRMNTWHVHPALRIASLAVLVIVVSVSAANLYGRKVAHLFKAATTSLDAGRPMAIADSDARSSTNFELKDMESSIKAHESDYAGYAPAVAQKQADGYELNGTKFDGSVQNVAPASEETVGNYRQKAQVQNLKAGTLGKVAEDSDLKIDSNASAFDPTRDQAKKDGRGEQERRARSGAKLARESAASDHNESADAESFHGQSLDEESQMNRGDIADGRLAQLENAEAKRKENAPQQQEQAQLRAADRLSQALAGKADKAKAPAPSSPGAESEKSRDKDLAAAAKPRPDDKKKMVERKGIPNDGPGGPQEGIAVVAAAGEGGGGSGASAGRFGGASPRRPGDAASPPKSEEPAIFNPESTPEPTPTPEPKPNLGLEAVQAALHGSDTIQFRRVERGLCEGAVPIAVSFPIAGMRKVEFQELALAGGDARLDVWCVAAGTSLGLQIGIVAVLGVGLLLLGRFRPFGGLLVAGLVLAAAFFLRRSVDAPLQPYVIAAIWPAGVSGALILVKALFVRGFGAASR